MTRIPVYMLAVPIIIIICENNGGKSLHKNRFIINFAVITSAKEFMFSPGFVCGFVSF